MFDALLFDLDGTLIDTESLAMASGMAAFSDVGFPVETEFMHRLVGIDGPTSARMIAARHPSLEFAALDRAWRAEFQSAMQRGLALKPGVAELLAQASHIPLVVVTSSRRADAHAKLALAGIDSHFIHVVSVDDVTRPKPAPEPYLLAASLLGLPPARCLAFEDSEAGSEAAHRAGCTVVQVPDVVPSQGKWAHHLAQDILSGARAAGFLR